MLEKLKMVIRVEMVNNIYIINTTGTLYFTNGESHYGEWKDDKRIGNGKSLLQY